jgi:hypothetical protein
MLVGYLSDASWIAVRMSRRTSSWKNDDSGQKICYFLLKRWGKRECVLQ